MESQQKEEGEKGDKVMIVREENPYEQIRQFVVVEKRRLSEAAFVGSFEDRANY